MKPGLRLAALLHPGRAPFALSRGMLHPRQLAVVCILLLSSLGWLIVALGVAAPVAEGRAVALGPGMGILGWLAGDVAQAPRWLQVLCAAGYPGASTPAATLGSIALTFAMWVAMALAMMLPTAAPMLTTYAELTETAARQQHRAVALWVLAAGYLTVWSAFAGIATALSITLTVWGRADVAMAPLGSVPAAAIFAAAGLYQFSALKTACLSACQSPFSFFFANWTDTRRGVFRLGLRQGLFCLGCCCAVMLVMFAVGIMNVVWMAGLGIAMTLEKVIPGNAVRRSIGAALLAISAGLLVGEAFARLA